MSRDDLLEQQKKKKKLTRRCISSPPGIRSALCHVCTCVILWTCICVYVCVFRFGGSCIFFSHKSEARRLNSLAWTTSR